jgi:hypothetical protein
MGCMALAAQEGREGEARGRYLLHSGRTHGGPNCFFPETEPAERSFLGWLAGIYISLGRLGWSKSDIDHADLKEIVAIAKQLDPNHSDLDELKLPNLEEYRKQQEELRGR